VRLRLNRGFDSAWYADAKHYGKLLQKDWLLSKTAWSFVQRSSRTTPKAQLTREQQLQQLSETRRVMEGGEAPKSSSNPSGSSSSVAGQTAGMRDYPNFRVGRVLIQHLPYKSYVNTFAYVPPDSGPQAKYGLFPKRTSRR